MKKFLSLMLVFAIVFVSANYVLAAEKVKKVKFQKKLLKKLELTDAGAKDTPVIVLRENLGDVTILGESVATPGQMINFINKRNPYPKLNCSVEELVRYYYDEANNEGIRADIAICQAIKETGAWDYGGDVDPDQNNYCGLGTTGNGVKGAYFETPQIGVRAHIQHLLAYVSKTHPKEKIVDPRYELIERYRPQIFGQIHTWTGLNGVWAVPGTNYGQSILTLWQQARLPDASPASAEFAEIQLATSADKAAAYVYRGLVNYAQGQYWRAQADFNDALVMEPTLTASLFDLALTQEKLDRYDDAIATYDEYLKLVPNNEEAYYNRGRLKLAQKNYTEAVADFEKAFAIQDRFVDALNEIAVIQHRQKKYDDAWKTIELAAQINTSNDVVNDNKAKFEACIKKK